MSELLQPNEILPPYEYELYKKTGPSLSDITQQRASWALGETIAQNPYPIGRIIIPESVLMGFTQELEKHDYGYYETSSHIYPHPDESQLNDHIDRDTMSNINRLATAFEHLTLEDAERRGLTTLKLHLATAFGKHTESIDGDWHVDVLSLLEVGVEPTLRYAITAIGATTQFAPGPLRQSDLNNLSEDSYRHLDPILQESLANPQQANQLEVAFFLEHTLHREPPADDLPRLFITSWISPQKTSPDLQRLWNELNPGAFDD